jgi:hypothetical protein
MLEEKAQQILEKFNKAKTKRQLKDPIWQELDAYDRNQQWDLQTSPDWLPKPVTNFVHLVKYTKRAALSVDNPTGKLRAVSPTGMERVKQLDKAFQFVWERIKARKVVRQNIETAKLLGDGIAQVYWEEHKEGRMGRTVLGDEGYKFEGEIMVREVDVSSFYPDPTAFTLEDCQYIFIKERKPYEWLKKHPIFGKKMNAAPTDDEQGTAPSDRGEIYLRDYTTEQKGIVDFLTYYKKSANGEGGFTYSCTYLVDEKIVHHIPQITPNRYPFARLQDFPQRHDFWSMSTCQFILDNQRIINKIESIITMIGTLMQNPQKVVSKMSGIDPEEMTTYGNLPGVTWVSNDNPSQSVHYIQPPQIPTVLFNLLENAKSNIREITGMNEAYMGQSVGSLQTSSGVQSLIDRATMRDRDQMYDVELYVEQLSNLIIDFMVTYYDSPRMIRVMGENPNEYEFENFLGTDFADLEYDMFIDISAKAPITRMKEAQDAQTLLNMQGQYGHQFKTSLIKPQEAVEMMELTNKDKIIERMNMEEMQNRTEQAMQVAGMIAEAQMNGVPPEEIQMMATNMFEQMEEEMKGTGSSSNANNVQMAQSGMGGF